MAKNEIEWRQPKEGKEFDREYQLASDRIGQYDAYILSFNRIYIAIVTAVLIARYYTKIPPCRLGFLATCTLLLVYLAVTAVRSVNTSFIKYCHHYWSNPKAEEEKIRQSFSQWMSRGWGATWDDFRDAIKSAPRVSTVVPFVVCLILVWGGVLGISKKDIETPPESEVTRVMYSQKTAGGTLEVEQVIKNATTQPADK